MSEVRPVAGLWQRKLGKALGLFKERIKNSAPSGGPVIGPDTFTDLAKILLSRLHALPREGE